VSSSSSSPSTSQSYSHATFTSSSGFQRPWFYVTRANYAAYAVVSVHSAAHSDPPDQSSGEKQPLDSSIISDNAAAHTCDTNSASVDFMVCSYSTRVVVSRSEDVPSQDRVFLPAWSRMFTGMMPVAVRLMTPSSWSTVHRLCRALQVSFVKRGIVFLGCHCSALADRMQHRPHRFTC
jgi:hypothetical protein